MSKPKKLTPAQAGRLGGLKRSKAKSKAVRKNGKQGGRPSLKIYNDEGDVLDY